jgi:hypothetical protein
MAEITNQARLGTQTPGTTDNTPQPEATPVPTTQPTETAAGVNSQQIQSDKAGMYKLADEAIASGAQKAGLPPPQIKTHLDRQKAAVEVYATLVANGKTDEAAAFLKTMGGIGEKFGANFGLSKPTGKGTSVALNADKWKGVDAAKNPYAAEYEKMVDEHAALKAQAGGKPQAENSASNIDPNNGTPQASNAGGTQATGNAGRPTPEQLNALRNELTILAGNDQKISLADIANSTKPLVKELLKPVAAQLAQNGADATMSVDEAIAVLVPTEPTPPNAAKGVGQPLGQTTAEPPDKLW